MISKNQVKYIASLHLKKNREQEKLFFVEGIKMVEELLSSSYTIHSIYALEGWSADDLQSERKDISIQTVTVQELSKISTLTTPQQVLALVSIPDYTIDQHALKEKLTLLLDDIKDPGNLGTIIRIADWFGIENIVCSPDTVDVYNPKVVQATMGSLFRVKVMYDNLSSFLKNNKNGLKLPVYAAAMKGTSVYEASLGNEGFIVLGNESIGVGKEVMGYVDSSLTIPSFATNSKGAESLNVAVASAIICSEFRRRKKLF